MPTYDLTRRLFLGSLGATLALPELRTAAQAPSAASAANVEKDVVYGKAGATDLHLDVYRPIGTANKRMAIIHFHGGGFIAGNKDMLAAQLQALSVHGYVNIAAQYRLASVARWPAQMEDVKASIRWTRANAAKLGIDPARIAVSGYSAGGHLALFAAGTANRPEFEGSSGTRGVKTDVAACLAYFAVTGPAWEGFRRFFPMPEGSSDAAWQAAMPGTYIKSFRPTILFHGLADVTVPPESSLDFLKQLRDARVPSELHTFAGVPHEFVTIPEFTDATAQLADFFLERHVINPRTYPPFGLGRGDGRGTDGGRGAEGRGGRQ
jgi:acetyl esterase/lipase